MSMTKDQLRDELKGLRDEAAVLVDMYLARPLMRGLSHVVGFFAAIGAGLALILQAVSAIQIAASIIYGVGLALALGVSALYHRIKWRPRAYYRIQKLDHSMIYVLIASSCMPFALVLLRGEWRVAVVVGMWFLALGGILLRWLVATQPRWLHVATYLGMGWAGVSLLPAISKMDTPMIALTVTGGVLYSIGALVYLFKYPNPLPKVFGFHEVFHALVIAAATCHFIVVWPLVTGPIPA